ncbi:MAG: glycoside hydrolase family 3 C-terminal domain-containing protein [Prevotella sp.]|nr:glycoside hydrolase family 3 C-terminal domain-containing protein [Prevotella sp.]
MKRLTVICAIALLVGCTTKTSEIDNQVDKLYDKMSQEERIAQLRSMYMDDLFDDQGKLDTTKCRQLIPNGIGHFSQFASQKPMDPNVLRDRVKAVQDWLMNHTPNGIPALFHEEVLSGVNTLGATIYPQQIGQACSFNTELAELKTLQTGIAMRKMGGVLSLSPMVDVCRTPSFNRLEESYGEDGYLSAAMGTAFVKGLQQGDLKKGVGTCSKHYLGYGGGGDAEEKELMEEILMPHETMIRLTDSKAVMPGYHAMLDEKGDTVNCVTNGKILKDILRDYLGFDGMVVSDYTAIDQIPDLQSPVEKAAAAINGGCDVDFPHGANYKYLQEAIDKGLVKPETLERAVKNVLKYKFRAGLFDKDPYLYTTEQIQLDSPEERQTAYDIATQSIVLLENNGILPLNNIQSSSQSEAAEPSAKFKVQSSKLNIFLTGPNANSMWAMCGDYSYPAMSYFWKMLEDVDKMDQPHVVTLLEGMNNYLNSTSPIKPSEPINPILSYSRGCDWTEEIETIFNKGGDERAWDYDILHRKVNSGEKADKAEALRLAQQADVIIAAVGENVMLCGENRDRQGLRLPGKQEQYVNELLATGKPVVLVVFGGRAQVISGIAEKCAAVIQAWYPGEEGGNAVADILFGKVSPSAKLSVSYPNTEINTPICYNNPSSLVSNPTLNAPNSSLIQWPFGYGLSYTTFEYKNLKVDKEVKTTAKEVNLSFEVTNTGKMTADEVAQVYLSPSTADQSIRPIQLQGFARVSLEPGQTKTVKVKLYTEQLGFYSHEQQRQWNILPGTYIIKVGASSTDIRLQEKVTLTGKAVSKPLREYYFSESRVE